jgi:PhnB protein
MSGCALDAGLESVGGAAEAIAFYKRAFGAVEMMRMPMPDGKPGYAELKIGDFPIMLADENAEAGVRSPKHYGGTPPKRAAVCGEHRCLI